MPTRNELAEQILWIVPERSGGIRTYAEGLLPALRRAAGDSIPVEWTLPHGALKTKAAIAHVQHEYGLFGSKVPGRYRFPKWFEATRRANPGVRWIATAHNVIGPDFFLPVRGRGWQAPLRLVANALLLPPLRRLWMNKTWGQFDGVIVHSDLQRAAVIASGCSHVTVIPHYVPRARVTETPRNGDVVVFGYFSPDKGQDIAIRAWAKLGPSVPKLVLAGGLRRSADGAYLARCQRLIRELNLSARVEITGFVPGERVDEIYREARFVIAPFRTTTGSGSIAAAFARGRAVIASDLPLNRELDRRIPGCLKFFDTESPESLARTIESLLSDFGSVRALADRAGVYAEAYSPEKIAKMHLAFYGTIAS